ncbi:MAG: hypothetical protein KBT57_09605, partial [bacterium]|nr:hypothetical protein [Candidatus Limimorpha equi]
SIRVTAICTATATAAMATLFVQCVPRVRNSPCFLLRAGAKNLPGGARTGVRKDGNSKRIAHGQCACCIYVRFVRDLCPVCCYLSVFCLPGCCHARLWRTWLLRWRFPDALDGTVEQYGKLVEKLLIHFGEFAFVMKKISIFAVEIYLENPNR